ncbi:MAG: hypothetical protein KGL39_41640 [Patescibacteria group bacterium]|nr:hypothetical protein [Patescibacteria group bacterium]
MRVLDVERRQGTVRTSSALTRFSPQFSQLNPETLWTGTVSLPNPSDVIDPNLTLVISWQRSMRPGIWEPVECGAIEWQGGLGQTAPVVTCQLLARRMRLEIDILRTVGDAFVAIGADISQNL